MTKHVSPPPTPVTLHAIRLDAGGLVVACQVTVPPHLRTRAATVAIDAMRQRMPVNVDGKTLRRVRYLLRKSI